MLIWPGKGFLTTNRGRRPNGQKQYTLSIQEQKIQGDEEKQGQKISPNCMLNRSCLLLCAEALGAAAPAAVAATGRAVNEDDDRGDMDTPEQRDAVGNPLGATCQHISKRKIGAVTYIHGLILAAQEKKNLQ